MTLKELNSCAYKPTTKMLSPLFAFTWSSPTLDLQQTWRILGSDEASILDILLSTFASLLSLVNIFRQLFTNSNLEFSCKHLDHIDDLTLSQATPGVLRAPRTKKQNIG